MTSDSSSPGGGLVATPPPTTPTLVGNPAVAQRLLDVNIRLRARSVEDFLARYSAFIDEDRIFIFTRAAPPVGTRLRFALRLQRGEVLLRGRGIVRRVNVDGERPGMELLFAAADDMSAHLLERMRRRRFPDESAAADAAASSSSPQLPSLPPTSLSWPSVRTPAPPASEFELPVVVDEPPGVTPAPPPPAAPLLETLAAPPRFREDVAARAPDSAADADVVLAANPLEGVSEGDLDYFVQWSLGEREDAATPAATLPEVTPPAPLRSRAPARPRSYTLLALAFAAGAAIATTATWLITRGSAAPAPPAVAPR